MAEVLIENPEEWLSEHNQVHIENRGVFDIVTANKHGDLNVGDKDSPILVNIEHSDITVL